MTMRAAEIALLLPDVYRRSASPGSVLAGILAALEELPDGGQLTVHHVRRPMHLYPRLDELGYSHETTELAPDKVQLLITKPVHPQ